nr:adenosylcobinamide-phosphate synthase CbiB [Parahaliea mediterranea]
MSLLLALLLDTALGEPRRWHPLAGFGALAGALERRWNRPGVAARARVWRGALAWLLLVVPPSAALWWLLAALAPLPSAAVGVVVLYLCVGNRSLAEHAGAVKLALVEGDLPRARRSVAMLVSRETGALDERGVSRAAVESVLENGSDAVIAPLFWFAVGGAPAALAHRLVNTLDACWGYRNDRYCHFGRVAARADDALNWLPARCCALLYALAGRFRPALRCWLRQGRRAASPNAGPVMSAGAGALAIWVGGPAVYHGKLEPRPVLGLGREAEPADIAQAVYLLWRATALFVLLACALHWIAGGGGWP